MSERESHTSEEEDPYWTDERALGRVYFGRDNRLVTLHSHPAEERFLGRCFETRFTLREREGLRTYTQSRLVTTPPVGRPIRLANAQAGHCP
jgi:hypothetical protein